MSWPLVLFAVALLLINAGIALICSAEQAEARLDAAGDFNADNMKVTGTPAPEHNKERRK